MGASDWKSFILISFLLFFAVIAVIKGIQFLAEYFGYESKEEKRFKKIEERITNLEQSAQTFYDNRVHDREVSRGIQKDLFDKISAIFDKLDKKESLDFKKLRHSIVQAGEDAIDKKEISIRRLKSIEEMYEEYTDNYDGNSYVQTLMVKVRNLPVIGKLNEHGEDIE